MLASDANMAHCKRCHMAMQKRTNYSRCLGQNNARPSTLGTCCICIFQKKTYAGLITALLPKDTVAEFMACRRQQPPPNFHLIPLNLTTDHSTKHRHMCSGPDLEIVIPQRHVPDRMLPFDRSSTHPQNMRTFWVALALGLVRT